MATYYKYAERSAASQINWAEVGKNMSDMLKEETRIREEKKATINAASREFGQTLANPPQGEHKGANQWTLEYADNASQFMLMQDRLLKSGQMKLKDYTVARQNILDGTDNAFNLTKDYQAVFANKMERYKTDKSQDLEQWLMAQAEGYSDFNKSQLYINPTDGTLSVAMKEKQVVDGKEVYVMNKNPNDFTSISTLKNQIAGKYDKYDTNAVTDAFVKGLGEEVTSIIKQGTSLTSGGLILNVEDIRKRTDLSEDGKQILYKFADSENQFIKSTLTNPFDRLSVLTNSKKFASNGKQYTFTYDEADAKSNPEKVLLRKDPRSNQPTPEFSAEQMKVSEDFMRTELRAKYSRKEELKPTPQAQLQERRAPTEGEMRRGDDKRIQQAAAGAWNQLYTGRTASEKQAAADILLGTPIAQEQGLLDIDMTQDGIISLKYENSTKNRDISYLNKEGKPISLYDFSGKGVELHGVVDRDQAVKAGGGGKGYGAISDFSTVRSKRAGKAAAPQDVSALITADLFTTQSEKSSTNLQSILPKGFIVTDIGGTFGNNVEVTAPNGKTYIYNANQKASKAESLVPGLQQFIQLNNVASTPAAASTMKPGNGR